ncbi:isoleucine--tRNA ligase [Brevibacillus fluminis]|uniref:Isoleucine--tRNA ligase n=1 Tax=Brevibacillus fluminis TaxID=511487 RepID=A0A3M8D3A0_9BACL|nr:isoleucine--tRNA ligase [Brevibacillus fluminis]RNB82393.1 isoleucine--tRNA ligase [Brevibacillus fluminis]
MEKVDVKEKARSRELRVLNQWREEETFKNSILQREGRPPFVFYEGPPTANGLPHPGHVLGRVIKDFIGRYKTMAGYRVVRKAGWDTHGLPVELGVEKQLGISGKQEIERYGVEAFIKKCKESVFAYEREWRELTEAIGYWTDMDDPYVTLKDEYIESVWHLLAEIHKKGLLYKGHRVSPYCPACQTSLSSHEVAQGYEDVKDLSATVKFRKKGTSDFFLAWTTTPWTLPANVALAVNPELTYARVRHDGETYIAAHNLVDGLFKGNYELLSTHKGAEFVDAGYEPPFAFIKPKRGHFVIAADFVSDTSGTGIVHIAPAHGEDDYHVTMQNGISMVNVVDDKGCYTEEVTSFAGRFVKDCDVDIVKELASRNLLFAKEKYEHSYPFCWRCKSPLLYYAMESWFIKTTAVKEQMIQNNNQVEWYPGHIKEGRFGKFLEELVDWNISRNRYWGTPLNVWVCNECEGQFAPGSRAELRAHALDPIDETLELHKPYVDAVKVKCPHCSGVMERTPEVIDVWFDSGSMPFAQYHYPFGNKETFAEQYPADMIVEGIDQTRGWFFSLLAVSTLFNGKLPYKSVLATGHVLDENGQKMSKSKGNVIDPWEIIEELGSDAFRWALLSDSAPWNSKRFSKQIVTEAKSKVIDTMHNTHAFYALYATIDGFDPNAHSERALQTELDRWILSRLHSVLAEVRRGLEANDFLNPAKKLEVFIDELSNWYLRRSRDRFWGSGLTEDKVAAYQTMHEVLMTISRMLAPYTPFLAEDIYQNVGGSGSVHYTLYPEVDTTAIDPELEQEMELVRQVVELARNVRNEAGIKTRQPLSELIVVSERAVALDAYAPIIQDEINVKKIRVEQGDADIVQYALKLNLKIGGAKYGKQVGMIQKYLRQLDPESARVIVEQGFAELQTETGERLRIASEELLVEKQAKQGFASATGYQLTVALHTEITPELLQEGFVREIVRAIQDARKKRELPITQRVELVFDVSQSGKAAIERFEDVLRDSVLLQSFAFGKCDGMEYVEVGVERVGVSIR